MTEKQKRTTRILIILLIIAVIIYSIAKRGCASQGLDTDENGNCIPQLYYCTGVWDGIGASQPYQPCVNGARPDGITPEGGCKTLAEIQVSCVNPYTNGNGNNPMPENPNNMEDNTNIVLPEAENDGCINSRVGFSPSDKCIDNEPVKPPVQQISGCTNRKAVNYNPLATIDDGSCVKPTMSDPLIPNYGVNPPPRPKNDSDCYSGNSNCDKYLWQYMNMQEPVKPVIPSNPATQPIDYGYKCVGASNPEENCQPCTELDSNCMTLEKCRQICLNSPAPPMN